jgi:hypothetical protein
MTRNGVPQNDKDRAFFEEAKARLLRTAPILEDAPDHPVGDAAGPRGLLDRLESLDGHIEATRRAVRDLKEAEEAATNAARRPASSPEEAYRTVYDARSFLDANEGPIHEADKTIATLKKKRHRVIERMAQTGFFEGRWVNADGRALYLESTATAPPAYELHEAPWGWVRNAPPGEDPRETLRRGPILERRYHRNNQTLLLLGVPFAAYCIVAALPPFLAHYSVAAAAVLLAALLFALPLARESLFGRLSPNAEAERRLVEEQAASAQLVLITRGERKHPSLEELTEAMLAALKKRRNEGSKIGLITVVEDPEKERSGHSRRPDAPAEEEEGVPGTPRMDRVQDAPSHNDERMPQEEEQG